MPITQHPRLIELIEYAQETAKMNDVPKTEVEAYGNFLFYHHQLQNLPGAQIDASPGDGSDEIWLRVERLREMTAPKPQSALLAVCLELTNDPNKTPYLKKSVTVKELESAGVKISAGEGKTLELQQQIPINTPGLKEKIEADFNAYLSNQWKTWAEAEIPRRRTIELYGKLFALRQQLEGGIADAQLELVWGVGIAIWRMNGVNVRFPLITKAVELALNGRTMAIEIRPRELDARLELDIYSNVENPEVSRLRQEARTFFEELNQKDELLSPFAKSSFEPLLRAAVARLDSQGIYLPDDKNAEQSTASLPKADERLKVTDSWVLFARPRGAGLFVEDLERFQRTLKQSGQVIELPSAVVAIVTEPSNISTDLQLPAFRGVSMVAGSDSSEKPQDLFFPMPFNDEQVRIVQLLEKSEGVVVQGPPGTGKTHTIANIICHYLALGKRVLVTSMREPALTVLQEKLPEEIRPLAVSLLTNENAGMKQFQYAIERIAQIVQTVDKQEMRRLIAAQETEIDNLHFQIAGCDRQIADWAHKNLNKFQIDDEFLEPRQAAEETAKNLTEATWLEDEISIEAQFAPRFSHEDVQRLRETRRILGSDLVYLSCRLPQIEAFPDVRDVLQTHQNLTRLAELEEQVDSGEIPHLIDSSEQTFQRAQEILKKIETLKKLRREIENDNADWTSRMRQRLRRNERDRMIELFSALGTEIEAAVNENQQFLSRPVFLPDGFAQNLELVQAVQNMATGARPFGLIGSVFGKSAEKKQLETVKILSSAPASDSDWTFVLEFIEREKRGRELIMRWNVLAGELMLPILTVDATSVRIAQNAFELYRKLKAAFELEAILSREIKAILPAWQRADLLVEDERIVLQAEEILTLHLNRGELAQTWAIKQRFHNVLAGCSGLIVDELRQFYENKFGNPELSESIVQNEWARLMEELRRVHSLQPALETVKTVAELIEKSGAPKWAEKLRRDVVTAADSLLPDNWRQLWRLKRLATYLESIDSRQELKRLIGDRAEKERLLTSAYRDAIKNRTWLKLKENTTDAVKAALEAYRTAISKIGKGTGKKANRFRQDARYAANQANPAIPCRIMPHYRISESLPAEFGCYDLVIIDEASQSDLSALPALLRAKKVLVVGDDKQVSPEGVGMLEARIVKTRQQFLQNQVEIYAAQMTPERSIYDLFKVVFAKAGVTLKEHFRCVAPIIEYSKREFYNGELVPLRVPKASERLDPPLIDVLVEDGLRLGDINKPEAEFIVAEIKKITADPIMQKRSIGIVSLLGAVQTKYIYERLEREIGFEKLEEYEIACGDPRTFQGKERDIMFLTMIVSKGNVAALGRDTFAQRFNVAASRARDRMYLVRSIGIDDLSPADKYRHSLIQHFSLPFAQDEKRVENLRELCESGFEREVYDLLTERGYRVTPQVKVAGYRIDLVVEGEGDARLAVECDGDRYHGPDKWDGDMRRQRILERAGWRFWRCFASTFVMYRTEVTEELIRTLSERGIKPTGHNYNGISRYVEHRRFNFVESRQNETEDGDGSRLAISESN
ncbi:MAG TPA: AAA domain-containing protein [Pyrinomonadaceae bacterium]|jgi:very-short-patch-repair endonuclease